MSPGSDEGMGKTDKGLTQRLLQLKPGQSCVVSNRRLDIRPARRHAPDRDWAAERVDGRWVVRRVS